MAGAESSVVMNPDYPIVGDHPLVPALWATCDAARDFGLSDAELWRIVQEVLSDWDRDPSLSEAVARLHDELAQAIVAKEPALLRSS